MWRSGRCSTSNRAYSQHIPGSNLLQIGARTSLAYMRLGYARVSTDNQTLDLQRDALKRAKCRQIYEEHVGGKTTIRPELEACLKSLRKGDTLVVWRLDR